MARNIEVNLLFQANTSQAVNNINQLGQLLNKISTNTTIGVDGGSIQKAVTSARELQIQLEKAVNVETGKLNLSVLNKNLKDSGQSLNTLAANLQGAGTTGQQAFIKLANAVSQAEVPMIRVNQRLKNFGTTLLNTVKWQLASNAIHAVSGILSSAVSHAEHLNTALNDIRIVTGYNVNTMAEFADQAARAAKQLGTTTEEYAKASLIFYQQGLTGKDVTDRADVVTKMMKVTGQSAEVVSSQMTAIWNNFAKAGDNLESYADKLTKLGAATAASTDEISDGLEKFAAVADTVGLSYDYAAASVAAVVAQTRQSADVVGTAFKTIFARLQDLKLGETLDDGTTLGQYSENLAKVGVNIQTADGQLKDMNVILEETAAKWEMLDKGQQVALAKGVAGIRQYNQFIALMDNWDFVQDNVELAENATGELTKQHDIWAQSYEGAAARVKQAQHNLYENFINDEDIVTLNNLFADLINGISNVVDSFGGLGPMVLTIVGLFSQTLFPLIINGFKNLGNVIGVWSGSAISQVTTMQQQMSQQMTETLNNNNNLNESTRRQIELSQTLLGLKQQLTIASKSMTTEEKLQAESRMQVYEAMHAQVSAILEKRAALEEEIRVLKESINTETLRSTTQRMGKNGLINDEIQKRLPNMDEEAARAKVNRLIDEATSKTKQQLEEEMKLKETSRNRYRELEKILILKEKIAKINSQDATQISAGKVSTNEYDSDRSVPASKMSIANVQQLANKDSGLTGGSFSNTDGLTADASIQNIETLYAKLGEYKVLLGDVTSIQKEFSEVQNLTKNTVGDNVEKIAGLKSAVKDLSTPLKNVKKAEEDVAKATEKYNKALEGKNFKEAKKARKEMQAASKQLAKAQNEVTTALKAQDPAYAKIIKAQQPLLQSKNKILDLARSMDASGESVKRLEEGFNRLEQSGDPAAISDINLVLKDLGIASQDTVFAIVDLATKMRDLLVEGGMDPAKVDPMIEKLKQLANSSVNASNGQKQLATEAEKLGNSFAIGQVGIGKFIGGLGAAAGKISMFVSGMNSITNAFKEGNNVMESMTTLLMGITMIMPGIIGLFKLTAGAKWAETQAEIASIIAKKAEQKEVGKLTFLQGLYNSVLAIGVVLKNHWVGIAIVGAAIAAGAAISALTASQQKQNEALEKANEDKLEDAKASKEQADANTELLRSYNDLLATYQETGEGKEDLDEAAQKLAEAYDIEGAALARLTGNYADYKKVSDAAYEANKKELENLLSEQEAALKINVDKVFEAAWDVGNQTDEADGNFRVTLDGKADQSAVFKYFDQNSEFFKGIRGNDDIDFELKNYEQNPEKFIEFYDYLKDAYNEMSKDEEATKYDSYTDLKELIAGMSDTIETARENYDAVKKYKLLLGKTEATEGFGDELQKVNTISEYIDWVDRLEKSMTDAKQSQDEINDAIKMFTDETTNPAIKSLKYYKEYIDGIKKEHGFGDEINNYFAGLSDEDKELFLNIKFDTYKTKEEWDKQLEFLKNQAEITDLKIKSDTVKATKDLIKETGMTEDDWIKVRDAGIEWGKDGIIEFNKFLSLSYEQQLKYLDELSKVYNNYREKDLKALIEEQKKHLKQLYEDRKNATSLEDYNTLTERIEQTLLLIDDYETSLEIISQQELNEIQTLYQTVEDLQDITINEYITQEQYDLLVKYNSELANYFQLTSKGFQLTKNPLEFQQELKKTELEKLQDNIKTTSNILTSSQDIMSKNERFANQDKVESAGYFNDNSFDIGTYSTQYKLVYGVDVVPQQQLPNMTSYIQAADAADKATQDKENYLNSYKVALNTNIIRYDDLTEEETDEDNFMKILEESGRIRRDNGILWNAGKINIQDTTKHWQQRYESYIEILNETEGKNNLPFNWQDLNDYTAMMNGWIQDYSKAETINFMNVQEEWLKAEEGAAEYIQQQANLIKNDTTTGDKIIEDGKLEINKKADEISKIINDGIQNYDDAEMKYNTAITQLSQYYNDLFNFATTAKEREQFYEDETKFTPDKSILDTAYVESQVKAIEQEKSEDIDTAELEEYSKYLIETAKSSDLLDDSLENNAENAKDVALYTLKMNKGVEKLSDNFKDWNSVLTSSDEASKEYMDAMVGIKDAMSDLLGVDEEFLTDSFIRDNLPLIEEAANGSAEAIDKLAIAAGESILVNIAVNDEQLEEQLKNLQSSLLEKVPDDIEVGATITTEMDTTGFIENANELVKTAGMTVEETQAYFNSLGYEPEFLMETKTVKRSVPQERTHTDYDVTQGSINIMGVELPIPTVDRITTTTIDGYKEMDEVIQVPAISADGTPKIKSLTKKSSGLMNNSSSKNPGGGSKGSSPKSGKAKKKDDVVKRYKEVDDQIEKHQRKLKQLETAEAGLYGKDKINSMYKRVEIAELENKELEEKIRQTREFLGLDRQNLQKALSDTGLGLQFEFSVDKNGFETISNYTPVMEQLYNKYKSVYNEYTGGQEDVDLTEDQEKEIKKWEDLMDNVNEYYEQYEETSDLLYDQLQEDREQDLKRQEDYFTALNEQLENSLEIETEQLDYIERKLALIADDCFELAEGLGLMLGSFNEDESWNSEGSQYGYLKSQKADLEAWRTDLETAYASGKINYNQYMEGMKTLRDMALSNAEAVKEFDTAMMEYYENSIDKITEKFSRLSNLQEHNIGMLDHMQSVVELLGKSADPRNLTAIVNAQKDVAKNNLEESEAWFDVMKEQAEFKKNEYDKKYAELASDGMTEEDWQILEGFEKEWLAAQEAANEAEDQMYSDFETWLEKTKEATKNAVDVANKQWEKSLLASMFGEKNPYASFEDVTLALDRQKSLQEDILDVTNKKYETDKLIRKVQQDIDKSTNSVAKKELKSFTERIKAKQDQKTLSETELGILEKEYELLQAKIALEEAQNAKSTVRLQRDSEGNFGYVYTADQDKVANAEQAYLDADNTLYNARLEAADDYGEKYIQAQQELYNTISEIDQAWQDGEYASYDEYLAARQAAFDHYEKLIVQYQGIYNNIFADNASWITDFTTDESRRLTGNVIDDVEGLQENIYADSRLMKGHIIDSAGMMSSTWRENMQNMDGETEGWRTSTDGYLKDVDGYFTDLQEDIKKEIEKSGGHFTAFKDIITPTNKTSKDSIDSLTTATSGVVEKSKNLTEMLTKDGGLIDALEEEMTFVGKVTTNYQAHRTEVQGLSGDYQTLAENVNKALLAEQNKKNWNESSSNESDNSKNTDTSKNNGNGSSSSSSNSTKWFGSATWERGVEVYDYINRGLLGNGINNRIAAGVTYGFNQDEVLLGQSIIDNVYPISKNGAGMAWEDAKKRLGFDTGGYTGEWDGGYGKLAFLHSKELVLNQGDTANFLASMELLDSIIKTIDLYSANAQWGGMLSTPTFGSYGSEPIQQNITIEAHFPDATDRNEIEEAFKSLGNLASQYITKY